MSSEKDPGSPSHRLAELEAWERVEQRLFNRLLFVIGGVVVVLLLFVVLVVPLMEGRIEKRLTTKLEQAVQSNAVDLPSLRQEMREDSAFLKEELVKAQVDLELRVESLLRQAEKLEETYAQIEVERKELASLRGQAASVSSLFVQKAGDLDKLHKTYERQLMEFRRSGDQIMTNTPTLMRAELGQLQNTVLRELDELRTILADHTAGNPAMFSTFVDVKQREGQITGSNFGKRPGRVFVRLRAFTDRANAPFYESDSILMGAKNWDDSEIEIEVSSTAAEKLAQAREAAKGNGSAALKFRFGFMVQTAEGRMSQWSGNWVDSVVPPSRPGSADGL